MASRIWLVAAALAATAVTVRAEPAPDKHARRLALAKVWLELKLAHPAVIRGQVDPDAAMPAAIAKVDAATTKEAQLQQVGIQPTIVAEPTIAGIRAGKDEVLDRAIQFATTGR